MGSTGERSSASPGGVVKAAIGYGGLAMCLTLVFLSMRAVMDVGGSCADGGPYVSAQSCPEGSTLGLLGGIFGGIGFTFLAAWGGGQVGGVFAGAPLFAWSGLFGSLGWNFLDYGVFSVPPGAGIDIGWLICGVMFWIMAAGGLLALVPLVTMRPSRFAPGGTAALGMRGPGQSARRTSMVSKPTTTTFTRDGATVTVSGTVFDGDLPDGVRDQVAALERQLADARARGETEASRDQLEAIARDFGAAIAATMAETPILVDGHPAKVHVEGGPTIVTATSPAPAAGRAAGSAPLPAAPVGSAPGAADASPIPGPEPDFTEGTQALLDRLERLADMRDRGLLTPDEFEAAKSRIMAALEERR